MPVVLAVLGCGRAAGGDMVLCAGCWCWVLGIAVHRCSVLACASDSEVITTAAFDSEG